MKANLWTRALWPLLGLGLLAVVGLQARAAVTGAAGRRSPAAPAPASSAAAPATGVAAEGRVVAYPGSEVVVGTDLAGTIVVLHVQEKDRVRRGQLLAELRSDDHRAALEEAKARWPNLRVFDWAAIARDFDAVHLTRSGLNCGGGVIPRLRWDVPSVWFPRAAIHVAATRTVSAVVG